jgi:hypothetical protein
MYHTVCVFVRINFGEFNEMKVTTEKFKIFFFYQGKKSPPASGSNSYPLTSRPLDPRVKGRSGRDIPLGSANGGRRRGRASFR